MPIVIHADLHDVAVKLLALAEARYGPREFGWSFTGVKFDDEGPRVYLGVTEPWVRIELNPGCLEYPDQLLYQMAHEVVHLLAPNRNSPTIMLEEGVATKFSIYAPTFQPGYRQSAIRHLFEDPNAANYRDALLVFDELSWIDADAVRKLRLVNPAFHEYAPEFIRSVLPAISSDLADRLCERRAMR